MSQLHVREMSCTIRIVRVSRTFTLYSKWHIPVWPMPSTSGTTLSVVSRLIRWLNLYHTRLLMNIDSFDCSIILALLPSNNRPKWTTKSRWMVHIWAHNNFPLDQKLVDQLLDRSRHIKSAILSRLTPHPSPLSFPGLIAYANTLENKRWFEVRFSFLLFAWLNLSILQSELKLRIRLLAIEARRELIQNCQLDEAFECNGMTHVAVAYSAMCRDIFDEERQLKSGKAEEGKDEVYIFVSWWLFCLYLSRKAWRI